jgi:hypothetical protein
MSITYNASTNFGAKDALPTNDPNKVIYGSEFTTEFVAIGTAFGEAAPTASPTFTGTATFSGDVALNGSVTLGTLQIGTESISDTDVQNWNATKATVDAGATGWDATKATVDAGAANWDTAYGWGDHSVEGYGLAADIPTNNNELTNGAGYITAGDVPAATTYTGGTNISLSGTTFNLDSSLVSISDIDTASVTLGSWEIKLDGNDLRFIYGGTDRIRFTTSGAIIAENNITAYGSA